MTRRRYIVVVWGVAAVVLLGCSSSGDGSASTKRADLERSTTTAASSTSSSSSSTTLPPAPTTTTLPVDVFALTPPAAAQDPAALAAQIASAEAVIRNPASTDAKVAAAALAQQVAYRQLGVHPEWDADVLGAVPPELRATVEGNAAARREFRAMHRKLATALPAWQIVPPAPHAELLASYHEAEATFGIPWRYLAAINLVETATGRIRGTSTAGAQGPMQFMPATWAAYGAGGNIDDPHDAIMGAARYLAANNGAVDIDHALYRYNHSNHYVRGVRLYADLIAEHPGAALAYYHWGVWYLTDHGELYLPVGYPDVPALSPAR